MLCKVYSKPHRFVPFIDHKIVTVAFKNILELHTMTFGAMAQHTSSIIGCQSSLTGYIMLTSSGRGYHYMICKY